MSSTAFSTLRPSLSVEEDPTDFSAFQPGRENQDCISWPRRRDVVTEFANNASEYQVDKTTLAVDIEWLILLPMRHTVAEDFRGQVLRAVDEIEEVLGLSETATAGIIGIARNTLASWRKKERDPYPATVRNIFEVQSVVAAATALFGVDDARSWFAGRSDTDKVRRDLLGSREGIDFLTTEMRSSIFRGAPSVLPLPDEFDEDVNDKHGVYSSEAFDGQVVVEPSIS